MTSDERTNAWLAAERAASEAEKAIAAIGQAASDPRVAALVQQAAQLRADADRMFRALRDHLRDQGGAP
jgi:predicted metal-dependent hydrolase